MARQPKPWYRTDRKVWCVTINSQRHNLGPAKKKAFERFYALMKEPKREKVTNNSMLEIIDAFLDWTHRNRSEATYEWYREHLQSFAKCNSGLFIEQLRPYHVEKWASSRPRNVNTRRNMLRAVKRCFKWAESQGYVDRNPIARLEIPSPIPREIYVSPSEFENLKEFVVSTDFADLLTVTYETGCRPQESLRVEARHVDLKHARWVFPAGEAKVKSMPRVVYLSEYAVEVSRRLMKSYLKGPLFRNSNGTPWNKHSVSCSFDRLQIKMGKHELQRRGETLDAEEIEVYARELSPTRTICGTVVPKSKSDLLCEARRKLMQRRARQVVQKYSLYALRHSWATNALQSGVDALTVAILMGHKDPSTLARTYQHLSHNPEHLLAQARRASA